jgi:hypothetical protein
MVRHKFSKKYTSSDVAYGVRDIAPWVAAPGAARSGPLAWPRRSALRRGVSGLTSWATASGLSSAAHGGSRPPSTVAHGARVPTPI